MCASKELVITVNSLEIFIASYNFFALYENFRNKLFIGTCCCGCNPRTTSTQLFLLHTTPFFSCRRCFRISLYAIMARSLSLSALSCSRADICLRFLAFGSPAPTEVLVCAFVSQFGSFSCETNEWSNSVFDPYHKERKHIKETRQSSSTIIVA